MKLEADKKMLEEDFSNFKKQYKSMNDSINTLENEISSNKIKIGKILNIAFEAGGAELVEQIENEIFE